MAAECFKADANASRFHQTIDGMCFKNFNDANNHSQNLKDEECFKDMEEADRRKIVEVNRETKAKAKSEGNVSDLEKAEAEAKAEAKAKAEAEAKAESKAKRSK